METRDLRSVSLAAFFFVLIAGALLQLAILPATPWHAGVGLMEGGDWVSFHSLALGLAETVRKEGWSSWVLRVDGQAPASMAAACYVLTGIERPLVLLPLHGFLYGILAMSMYSIAYGLGATRLQARLLLLPLFFFPSTAMIWGQIHKDIYSVAGVLLVLRFWLRLWSMYPKRIGPSPIIIREMLLLALGLILISFVRPYLSGIVFAANLWMVAAILARIFSPFVGVNWLFSRERAATRPRLRMVLLMAIAVGIQLTMLSVESVESVESANPDCPTWVSNPHFPEALDRGLARMACVRERFSTHYVDAGSNIDVDVQFHAPQDLFLYMPRALQIVLFAPFPNTWLDDGAQPGGDVMRILIIPEVLTLYLMLPGLVVALVMPGLRFPVLLTLGFTLVLVVCHGLVVTNVGTLYRMRYPAMLVWILVGAMGWIKCSSLAFPKKVTR